MRRGVAATFRLGVLKRKLKTAATMKIEAYKMRGGRRQED
jgi:hypothetical protein